MNIYKKKKYLLFILMVLVVIGWLIFSGTYPVAFVGFKPIFAEDFNKNYSASMVYYEKALKTYAKNSQMLEADEIKKEIKRAVLDNLIENALIKKELKKEVGQNELNRLIDKKIKEISESQTFQKAAGTLYGFSFEEFKEKVLIPQAKREILESRIFLSGENFKEKLKEIKSKAKVMIFLPEFEWDGGKVIINSN